MSNTNNCNHDCENCENKCEEVEQGCNHDCDNCSQHCGGAHSKEDFLKPQNQVRLADGSNEETKNNS